MSASDESLDRLHRERMLAEGMPEVAIRSFLRALRFVREGGGTTLAEGELEPVEALPRADGLRTSKAPVARRSLEPSSSS